MRPAAMNGFRHEALFYRGQDDFLAHTVPFIRDGVLADEPVMVAVHPEKAQRLRSALDTASDRVLFVDMPALGRNPACIIPAWREFVSHHAGDGRPLRGIGEPVWAERTPDELIECDHHESLLNLAFAGGPDWTLLCPYDVGTLDAEVLAAARRNHPVVVKEGVVQPSDAYVPPERAGSPFEGPLPPPAGEVDELWFSHHALRTVRRFVEHHAQQAGLGVIRTEDLVLAVNELATNSLRHAGGRGCIKTWREDGALVCEVVDHGRITEPLVGRQRPPDDQPGGRGLWLVNHLCDLVQIRSRHNGNVIRLRMALNSR